jgi:hypothetical protein
MISESVYLHDGTKDRIMNPTVVKIHRLFVRDIVTRNGHIAQTWSQIHHKQPKCREKVFEQVKTVSTHAAR